MQVNELRDGWWWVEGTFDGNFKIFTIYLILKFMYELYVEIIYSLYYKKIYCENLFSKILIMYGIDYE